MQLKHPEFNKYVELGLSPIPLKEGEKRPIENDWQKYCSQQPTPAKIRDWEAQYNLNHIGLALGTEIESEYFLIAIDVDSDDMVEPVLNAIGTRDAPAKKGSKGLTIFGLAPSDVINQKIKRKDKDGKPERLPSVEILCHGSQTVVPPSIHPKTEKPYYWTTAPIEEGFPHRLPVITSWAIDEIIAVCQRKGDKIRDLNEMLWLGVDKGGNTHDTCVEAVAWMVSRDWPDQVIHQRIERAKREACARNGDKYNWPQATKTIQGWIDSAKEKGMQGSSKKKGKKAPPERVMALWGIEQLGGPENVATVDGQLRHYKDGHWPTINVEWLKKEMYEADVTLKKSDVKNALDIIHTLQSREYFGVTAGVDARHDPKRHRICLKNGTYNARTGQLEKHDRDHEILHQLDFDWDDKAECPTYDKFLSDTFKKDQQSMDLMEEFFALTLIDDMSFQKFLVLKGPGGNGKGTLARILKSMQDPDAVGSVSITDLNDERKRTSLVGKKVNISGEQSKLNTMADTYLKKITGEDPVDIRYLYGETRNNVMLTTRFIELVNEMPATSDNSDALKRRMIILRCENRVANPDPDLDKKLNAERAGIFKRWMSALGRLYKRGKFDPPMSSTEEIEDYMMENDSVKLWFHERMEECEADKGEPSNDLYGDYSEWAKNNGYRNPFISVVWGRRMNAMGCEPYNRRLGGSVVRCRPCRLRHGSDIPI